VLLASHRGVGPGEVLWRSAAGPEYTRVLASLLDGHLVSIDVGPTVAARAQRAAGTGASVAAADAEHLPFADGVFAAVVANAVLHHLRLGPAGYRPL
jgi:ubiquinone/menaquinone biosynthesis C-methylase UbiE